MQKFKVKSYQFKIISVCSAYLSIVKPQLIEQNWPPWIMTSSCQKLWQLGEKKKTSTKSNRFDEDSEEIFN